MGRGRAVRGRGPGRVQCVLDDFMCALQKRLLYQGRMFVFEHCICFHSNLFGHKKDKVIPLQVLLASAPIAAPFGALHTQRGALLAALDGRAECTAGNDCFLLVRRHRCGKS